MQRHLTEVLVSAAGPSSAGQGSGTVTIHDLNTGSSLLTLKQNFSAPHASVATETRDGQGGLILSAQIDKGLMNVYSYQKVLQLNPLCSSQEIIGATGPTSSADRTS